MEWFFFPKYTIPSISSCMIKAEEGNNPLCFVVFFSEIRLLSGCSGLMDSLFFVLFFSFLFLLLLLRFCISVVRIILLQGIFTETLYRSQIQEKNLYLYLISCHYDTHIWRKLKIRSKSNPALIPDAMTTVIELEHLQHLECFGICGLYM